MFSHTMAGVKSETMSRADIFPTCLNIIAITASRLVPPRKVWKCTYQKSTGIKFRSRNMWGWFNEVIKLVFTQISASFSDMTVWVPWKLLPSFQIAKTSKTQRSSTNLWVGARRFQGLLSAQYAKTSKPRDAVWSGTMWSLSTSGVFLGTTVMSVTKTSKVGMLWQCTTPHSTQPDQKLFQHKWMSYPPFPKFQTCFRMTPGAWT